MTFAASILITGATGTVGSALLELFEAARRPVRAGMRRRDGYAGYGDPVELDFTRPETFAPALQGVRQLFLVRPPAIARVRKYLYPFVEAAEAAGVRQIVFLSVQGADKNPFVPHRQVERRLIDSPISQVLLRPSFFMQNLTTTHREEIRERDELFVPAGKGKTSFIDVRDIAAVAYAALDEPQLHRDRAYTLTGSRALGYHEVAETLSGVLSRRIRYAEPSLLEFALRKLGEGNAPLFVLVMCGIYTVSRLGLAAGTTPTVEHLLGRPPISFEQFAEDHASCWRPTSEQNPAVA